MRRSTRLSIKRISLPSDSSEDEDEANKPELKVNKKVRLSQRKTKQEDSKADESTQSKLDSKTSSIPRASHQKPKEESNNDDSSSESDIENYLQPADQIDLNSTFFELNKPVEKKSFEAIESNIFAGINRLSDSESASDFDHDEPTSTKKPKVRTTKSKDSKPSPEISLQHLQDYSKKLEEAKKSIEKYEASKKVKKGKQKVNVNKKSEDSQEIAKLLALGEAKPDLSAEHQDSIHSSDFESCSESEKEDWEEVEEGDIKDTQKNIIIPKDDLQITVELPTVMRQKKGKDLVASMKRRLNRIRKENQVLVHKVHLLCWLGHGNYINEVLNCEGLLAMVLSIVPPQHCNTKGRTNWKYLEQMVKWYRNTIPNIEKHSAKDLSLYKLLKLQIIRKEVFNKKMLVYLFVCVLRSLGIHCRLVLSFQVTPLRPPVSELHSLSTKNKNKKIVKEKNKETSVLEETENTQSTQINGDEVAKDENSEEQKAIKKSIELINGKTKITENEIQTESKQTRTKNAKKSDQKTADEDSKKTIKGSSKKGKLAEDKNKPKNIINGQPLANGFHTESSKNKKSVGDKKESHKVEASTKPKTRSQSAKEEEFQNKNRSDSLSTKPAARSKSSSEFNDVQPKTPNNSKMNTRRSLSLKTKNNNELSLKIPQVDGANDSDDEPAMLQKAKKGKSKKEIISPVKKHTRRTKSLPDYTEINSDDDFQPQQPKRSTSNIKHSVAKSNADNAKQKLKLAKRKGQNRRSQTRSDTDSDYTPEPVKKKYHDSDEEFHEKTIVRPKRQVTTKKEPDVEEVKTKKGFDIWVEVYLEAEEKWISVDIVKGQVNCVNELNSRASHPITYVIGWDNNNSVKDITQRYCPQWNTVTRKLRIDRKWWDETLTPFGGQKSARDKKEDEELAEIQLAKPLPTTINEYKDHPLYVLKRHLLKFEALYPPEPAILGFVRKEAVYSRDCVYKLQTRENWYKQAKVVKPGETPYRILKTLKWDKISRQILRDQPLEVYGVWQVEDYVPPAAENGVVPRNEYGNVELFQLSMLPKGTVHLQLPGLNKLARRMNIDCAPAMVGFDFHSGWTHPVFDGFVVCEEHSESLIAAWYLEQEEQEKREQEKVEKRVYGNWKKLIKGLLIRERLKARYDFGVPAPAPNTGKKRKSKGPKFVSKKRRLCSENESDSEED